MGNAMQSPFYLQCATTGPSEAALELLLFCMSAMESSRSGLGDSGTPKSGQEVRWNWRTTWGGPRSLPSSSSWKDHRREGVVRRVRTCETIELVFEMSTQKRLGVKLAPLKGPGIGLFVFEMSMQKKDRAPRLAHLKGSGTELAGIFPSWHFHIFRYKYQDGCLGKFSSSVLAIQKKYRYLNFNGWRHMLWPMFCDNNSML